MPAAPPAQPGRLVYLGTPAMAVPPLQALVAAGHDVALVVSRADAKRGRGGHLVPSPVKAAAVELGLPVTDRLDDAVDVGADLGVVVAYGRIIPARVLDVLPMVNIHFSLLPRWRGAAPLERAVQAGDTETGVCLMAVAEGLDEGDVYARTVVPIGPDDTADDLRPRLVAAGSDLLLAALRDGLGEPEPQHGEITYAHKIDPAELHVDWSMPAGEVHDLVRMGGAWTTFRGKRLKVWRTTDPRATPVVGLAPGELVGGTVQVGTGDGTVTLVEVQPEGKGRQAAGAWRNGAQPAAGERLGDERADDAPAGSGARPAAAPEGPT